MRKLEALPNIYTAQLDNEVSYFKGKYWRDLALLVTIENCSGDSVNIASLNFKLDLKNGSSLFTSSARSLTGVVDTRKNIITKADISCIYVVTKETGKETEKFLHELLKPNISYDDILNHVKKAIIPIKIAINGYGQFDPGAKHHKLMLS